MTGEGYVVLDGDHLNVKRIERQVFTRMSWR